MTTSTPLDALKIASPCRASWADMKGDDRVRHCPACDKSVYNLSAMKAEEAAELIRRAEGRLCARLYRRRDGTILTADCPVGVRSAMPRRLRRLALGGVVAAVLAQVGAAFAGRVSWAERWGRIPPVPIGTNATLRDLSDWALDVLGLAPNRGRVELGGICAPPSPSSGTQALSAEDL